MKTNEEYWKQRCLLAESRLEEMFNQKDVCIDNTSVTISPFEKFNWLHLEFMDLLKDNNLTYNYIYNKLNKHFIDVKDSLGIVLFTIEDYTKEATYRVALSRLKYELGLLNKTL